MIAGPDTTAVATGARVEALPTLPSGRDDGHQKPFSESRPGPTEGERSKAAPVAGPSGSGLSPEAQAELRKLQEVDRKVRQHERAHRSAGGHLTGPAQYQYQRGPDGSLYAVSGEVSIRIPTGGDPEQRIRHLEQVIAAALAPADPSPQDRAVAAQARAEIARAQAELAQQQREEQRSESDPSPANLDISGPQGAAAAPDERVAAYVRANTLFAEAQRPAVSLSA